MSVQQIVMGASDRAAWAPSETLSPAPTGHISLRETCHLLLTLGLLLCVTLALFTSTALIDTLLRALGIN